MKIGELASQVAKIEGHKSQSRIGDVREILGIIADMSYKSPDAVQCLIQSGIARAKRRRKVTPPSV